LDVPALPVPAALPPVPRLVLVLPLPALLPPVPSVLAEPLPVLPPEPAALPPVPSEVLLVPPPALLPPVPSVLADPLPALLPAAHSPVSPHSRVPQSPERVGRPAIASGGNPRAPVVLLNETH